MATVHPKRSRGRAATGRARVAWLLGLTATLLLVAALAVALRPAPPPQQPLPFSHRQHAGAVGLDCQFCHSAARRSSVAGVPSVASCMGCHTEVLPDQPDVRELRRFWEEREPIPWQQVYDLPEYVRFSHQPHVRAGVGCDACHGDVAQMDRVGRTVSLSMGWCVSCHTRQEASVDCLVCHY